MASKYDIPNCSTSPLSPLSPRSAGICTLIREKNEILNTNNRLKAENADLTKEVGLLNAQCSRNREASMKLLSELNMVVTESIAIQAERDEYKAKVEELERKLAEK